MNSKLKTSFLIFILTKSLFGNSVCQTAFGRCMVSANLNIGSPCYCGYDQGSVIGNQSQQMSNVCQTPQTYCQVNFAPVGSGCGCMTPYGPSYGSIRPR